MQSRKMSLVESVCNVTVGILVAFCANMLVLPLFGYQVSYMDGIGIALVFTVISLVRSYIVRRLFNRMGR